MSEKNGASAPMARITIAVVNEKGGAGKTTTTLNLAGALVERGLRVLAIDLDRQSSLTTMTLDAPNGLPTIGHYLMHPADALANSVVSLPIGFDIVAGGREMETVEYALATNPTAPLRLRKLLAPLVEYDAIVLDTPPSTGLAFAAAVLSATIVVIPTLSTQADFDALTATLARLDDLRELNATGRRVIVPNSYRADGSDKEGVAALRAAFGGQVADPIPLAASIKKANNSRRPVVQYERTGAPAKAYRALVERVLAPEGEALHV